MSGRRWVAVVAAAALAASAGLAGAEPLSMNRILGPMVPCTFEGWSNDPDPAGLPVRANPDPYAAPIGRIPPRKVIGLDEVAPTVQVDGYQDGWFRISGASLPVEADPNHARMYSVFRGQGWVPSVMVKTALAAPVLRTAPRADAPRKANLQGSRPDGQGGSFRITPDMVAVKKLLSCKGSWVEVDTEFGPGWVDRVCGRQLTGCP
jgi:hypothetical protein